MSDDPRLPYTVTGIYKNGFRRFLCPTPQWALRKVAEFERKGYTNITVTGPNGPLTEAELLSLVEVPTRSGNGAAVSVAVSNAPAPMVCLSGDAIVEAECVGRGPLRWRWVFVCVESAAVIERSEPMFKTRAAALRTGNQILLSRQNRARKAELSHV